MSASVVIIGKIFKCLLMKKWLISYDLSILRNTVPILKKNVITLMCKALDTVGKKGSCRTLCSMALFRGEKM